MNFIYIGSSRPEEITKEYLKMGSFVNFASQTLQDALLTGFSKHLSTIKIITSWRISSFPKVKKIFFKKQQLKEYGTKDYVFVGAINLPGINLIAKLIKTRHELKKMLVNGDQNIVFIYEVHTPFIIAAISLRRKIDKICLIIPDLPQFMSGNTNKLHTFLKNIDSCIINKFIRKIDSFVLLSNHMKEGLPIGDKPCLLMEGIFRNTFSNEEIIKETLKTIMYTGGVFRRRGSDLLVNAFRQIPNHDYQLWIRGDGDMVSEIKEISKVDPRIVYLEPMSRNELLKLEQQATVMVNPTQPSLYFTKYFFPSKTMEYLATGTPTVMFKLECMPDEYNDYLFYVENESIEGLRDKLIEVCEKPKDELHAFGQKAKEFILEKKSPEVQCKRIIDFIINS